MRGEEGGPGGDEENQEGSAERLEDVDEKPIAEGMGRHRRRCRDGDSEAQEDGVRQERPEGSDEGDESVADATCLAIMKETRVSGRIPQETLNLGHDFFLMPDPQMPASRVAHEAGARNVLGRMTGA